MLDIIAEVNGMINDIVWGIPGLTLVLFTGIFLTFKLDFLQFRYLLSFLRKKIWCSSANDKSFFGELAAFKAAMVSISAMIGSGNIAGVATAVVLGGPGALFWMVLAAFIGMATKFSEIFLSVKYRKSYGENNVNGGPMHYFETRLGQKWLGIVYAVFTMFYAIVITAVVDSNTISLVINERFEIPTTITGAILAVATAVVILGGVKSVGATCKFLSPFMAGAYIFCGLFVILSNYAKIPDALCLIINSAFNPAAYTGGAVGSLFICMRYGIARGIFSNDAGLGVAGIIHATAKVKNEIEQAVWGPVEVFLDTVLICGISGMVIVLSGVYNNGMDGGVLAMSSYEALIPGGSLICLAALCFFGYSCIISFYVYVDKAGEYLFGNRYKLLLKLMWILFVFIGSQSTLGVVWDLADTVNGLMMIPNLIALLILSSEVKEAKQNKLSDVIRNY